MGTLLYSRSLHVLRNWIRLKNYISNPILYLLYILLFKHIQTQ